MTTREQYVPGPVHADVEKDGEKWTLVIVREFRQSPDKVWNALTDPAQLREWAPFDATGNMGAAGAKVKLTTVGAPGPHVTESTVTHAEANRLLVYNWGDFNMKWQLEPLNGGTKLTLWSNIDRRFIAMGAAGWHLCLDVLDHYLTNDPIGRSVGPEAMHFPGWQQLNQKYSKQFGVTAPSW